MATTASCHPSCRGPTNCPPWLQAALADIEQRVQSLAPAAPAATAAEPDSFAERAENYYQKRPQLLSLLHDLHHRYRYLADRYSQSLLKPHARKLSADTDDESDFQACLSDAESSLSFQHPPLVKDAEPADEGCGLEWVVAELVGAMVERELAVHELGEAERRGAESARKAELQGSLLEVLESERLVLLGENARVGLQAAAAEEEARGLAAELGYVRRRAGELARCVVKLREDHRVCLLGRRIEGLQAQIYALERRNRECYEAMARRELEKGEARYEMERLRAENGRLREEAAARRKKARKDSVAKWWGRVRSVDWALCGTHVQKGRKDWLYC